MFSSIQNLIFMRKKLGFIIMLIVIFQGILPIPNAQSEDTKIEWTENIIKEGTISSDIVRIHIQVNRTVVEIAVNLSWSTENGYANLDMWIEGTDSFIVEASSTTQMPEIMVVREFPNRGRWTLVLTPTACGSCGYANYSLNITLRNIVLPEFKVIPKKIESGEKVNMSVDSVYENISLYYFDFGDDTNSGWINESSISKTYNKSGEYIPKAKVRYTDGTESDWIEVDLIEVEKEEKGNIILWVLIWLGIFVSIIFLITYLHERKEGV